jgi:hypothetical protein
MIRVHVTQNQAAVTRRRPRAFSRDRKCAGVRDAFRSRFSLACAGGVFAAYALTAGACGSYTVEPLPLEITLTADKLTTVPSDSINFEIRAQGGVLLGLSIEWGDGNSRELDLNGARTVTANLRHAYQQSGVYQVSAAVDDAAAGEETAMLTVTIQ